MPLYNIFVSRVCSGVIAIEADSPEEAAGLAKDEPVENFTFTRGDIYIEDTLSLPEVVAVSK